MTPYTEKNQSLIQEPNYLLIYGNSHRPFKVGFLRE